MNSRCKSRFSGFTFIELSIVLCVAGVLFAGALDFQRVYMVGKSMQDTKDRITVIETAMMAFRQQNGRLPCPAAMNAQPGSSGFGTEDSSACASGTPPTTWNGSTLTVQNPAAGPGLSVRIGAVPFVALGIPVQDIVDGWNDRFVYAVSEQLADKTIPYNELNGAITLIDNATPPNVYGPNPNHTPFVLISLGPSGHGAYTYAGVHGGAPCLPGGPQYMNCAFEISPGATFRNMPYSNSSNNAIRFDNILTANLLYSDPVSICGNQGMIYGPGHPLADVNGCVPRMVEAPNGNVGIVTSSPLTTLDVHGEVKLGNTGVACTAAIAGSVRNNANTNFIEYCSPSAGPGNSPAWIPLMPLPMVNGYVGWIGNYCADATACNPSPVTAHFNYGGTCTPQQRGSAELLTAGTASTGADLIISDGVYFCLCGTTNFNNITQCSWIGMQSTPSDN